MSHLLIVANTSSENTVLLRHAVEEGAYSTGIKTLALSPFDAQPEHVLQASGIIIGTTENFGYMSGAIKDFFERVYYPCLEHTEALPCALYIKAGNDGLGAKNSVERILLGLRWKQVQEPMLMVGDFKPEFIDQCKELGEAMAEGIKLGIF